MEQKNSTYASVIKRVHHLIVLDESGSMESIYKAALTGVNESLQSIRSNNLAHPDQEHTVTLVTFDSEHYNMIYDAVPARDTKDLTPDQYQPNACTPLYDAMGRSLNGLRKHVEKGDIVLVTVITDGYENASREYNHNAISSLVKTLRAEGWVFTYIGANQDVEAVASSLSIDNHLEFEADEERTNEMFSKLNMCRSAFVSKISDPGNCEDYQTGFFDL